MKFQEEKEGQLRKEWGRDSLFLFHRQKQTMAKNEERVGWGGERKEERKFQQKDYRFLITRTRSLPSPIDSERTSGSSARII